MKAAASPKLTKPVTERDHIRGSAKALVTLVEYGDFECPHCGAAYPVVDELIEKLGDRLRFVFRHFPLTQVHPHALNAAEAAEAAGAQGKFWEMHDMLFEHQNALDTADLLRYAAELDLDVATFKRALATQAFEARIRDDVVAGARSGVNGTPTFFIEGYRYDGYPDFSSLMTALEDAMERRGAQGSK